MTLTKNNSRFCYCIRDEHLFLCISVLHRIETRVKNFLLVWFQRLSILFDDTEGNPWKMFEEHRRLGRIVVVDRKSLKSGEIR